MIKIAYIQDWNEDGTHYTQRITATGKDGIKIAELLHKEYEVAQQVKKTKTVYSSEEMHKIAYQKTLTETNKKQNGKLYNYYLNLTQLGTITQNLRDLLRNEDGSFSARAFLTAKRLKYRNSVLALEF